MIVFDKGYVDYAQYERFTKDEVYYVIRLKDNAIYECGDEYDIPDDADNKFIEPKFYNELLKQKKYYFCIKFYNI